MASVIEISQRLNVSVDHVTKSPTIKSTYDDIKNNPDMSTQEKEDAFDEMAEILSDMLQNK